MLMTIVHGGVAEVHGDVIVMLITGPGGNGAGVSVTTAVDLTHAGDVLEPHAEVLFQPSIPNVHVPLLVGNKFANVCPGVTGPISVASRKSRCPQVGGVAVAHAPVVGGPLVGTVKFTVPGN